MTFDYKEQNRRCRHFTGIGDATCKLGVNYSASFLSQKLSLPCTCGLRFAGHELGTCSKLDPLTDAELEQQQQRSRERIAKYFSDIDAGNCPHCGKAAEPIKQVGSCIYAACGHRIANYLTIHGGKS